MSSNSNSNTFIEKSRQLSVLSIVGPTGVGKTEVSWKVAQQLAESDHFSGCDLISADSKQVYADLAILSGADIPTDAEKYHDQAGNMYFRRGKCRLFGVSMLTADQSWSVAQFQVFALSIIAQAQESNRAIMLVGGTGLYHDRVFENDEQLRVPRDESLRNKLAGLPIEQLQSTLQSLDPVRFQTMNHSDQHNPRRLERAIEVAAYFASEETNLSTEVVHASMDTSHYAHQYLGLTAPDQVLRKRIEKRVQARVAAGAIQEVEQIIRLPDISETAEATLGFSQIQQYLTQRISVEECVRLWGIAEWQYLKRQRTWWKKKDIFWLDLTDADAEDKLQRWLKKTSLLNST
ncbi:MAG: isopentenyl transferase family protein [Patescibacteria group bacterium]